MSNSTLFKQAHKMTKLTIQPNETYRYKFGQWLIFLKNGITNTLGFTSINQSVCYVPILEHDKVSYSMSLPLTLTKTTKRNNGNTKYMQYWHLDRYMADVVLYLLDSKLFVSLVIIMQFMLILKFI